MRAAPPNPQPAPISTGREIITLDGPHQPLGIHQVFKINGRPGRFVVCEKLPDNKYVVERALGNRKDFRRADRIARQFKKANKK